MRQTEPGTTSIGQGPCYPASSRPIMIIGGGRSGTTLLQSMLNAHEEICFTPETHFVRRYLRGHRNRWRGAKLRQALITDNWVNRVSLPMDRLCDSLVQAGKLTPDSFFPLLLSEYASKKGCRVVGDKNPLNGLYVRHIKRVFPGARVLHIIRDPRDVVISRLGTEWGGKQPFSFNVAICALTTDVAQRDGRRWFGDSYIELKYEDLVTKPTETLTTLCNRLGLEFQEEMLRFNTHAAELVTEGEMAWKANVLKPLKSNNVGKWQGKLSRRQVLAIEGACHYAFKNAGYSYSTGSSTGGRMVASLASRALVSVLKTVRTLRLGWC